MVTLGAPHPLLHVEHWRGVFVCVRACACVCALVLAVAVRRDVCSAHGGRHVCEVVARVGVSWLHALVDHCSSPWRLIPLCEQHRITLSFPPHSTLLWRSVEV